MELPKNNLGISVQLGGVDEESPVTPREAKFQVVEDQEIQEVQRTIVPTEKEIMRVDVESVHEEILTGSPQRKRQKKEMLKVKRLSKFAILPKRATEGAAEYDLYSAMVTVVPTNGQMLIKTDISIEILAGTYARIAPGQVLP